MVIAGYAARRLSMRLHRTDVELYVVDELQQYIDTERLLRDAHAPEPPYWAHLWPGSRALARLLASEIDCDGRRVLDIGCGVGLPGLVASVRGAAATLIDTAEAALHFCQASAALNHCQLQTIQTDIRAAGICGRFDYAMAADITYDPVLQRTLAEFLDDHLARDGRAWCAESVRTFDVGLRDACARRGFRTAEQMVRQPDEDRETSVRITTIWRA